VDVGIAKAISKPDVRQASFAGHVVWNVAMIANLLWGGRHHSESRLAVLLAIGSVVGSDCSLLCNFQQSCTSCGLAAGHCSSNQFQQRGGFFRVCSSNPIVGES
jgi:hypothetical protein